MRKEIVILAAIVVITISAAVVAVANMSVDPGNSQQIKGLTYDVKAQSRMTTLDADEEALTQLHAVKEPPVDYFSLPMPYNETLSRRVDMGHAVLFTHPGPFIVNAIYIDGEYTNESGYVPFAVELMDENGRLLYKLTDISAAYFPTKYGSESTVIEIPATKIEGDFYVIFYPRNSVAVGAYVGALDNRSFMVARGLGMFPAVTEGHPFEWAISVVGRDA